MKCVAHIPQPVAAAAIASQPVRIEPADRRT
jgi:hypothetical protein